MIGKPSKPKVLDPLRFSILCVAVLLRAVGSSMARVLSVRYRPAVADRLWRFVVEEWLSGWPISSERTFPQVSGILSCAGRLPVKPSA